MNLRAIPTMAAAFGVPVGLSDHTLGIHVATAAIALGAQLLEKHFTLDRTRSGPDHPFAIEPDELKELVAHVRDVEAALGDGVKRGPSDEERVEMYAKARRSVVAAAAIPAGTRITREMLTIKRPGSRHRAQAHRRARGPHRRGRHRRRRRRHVGNAVRLRE